MRHEYDTVTTFRNEHATYDIASYKDHHVACRSTTYPRHGYDTTTLDKGPPGRSPRLFDVAGEVLPITAPPAPKRKT